MAGLPMDFSDVLAEFQSPLPVRVCRTMGTYIRGSWQENGPESSREIAAIVLAMKVADLEFYREGNASVSGITLTTQEQLQWADVNNSGVEQRQDYVEHQGYRFRVVGEGYMMGNTDQHIYQCIRFLQ